MAVASPSTRAVQRSHSRGKGWLPTATCVLHVPHVLQVVLHLTGREKEWLPLGAKLEQRARQVTAFVVPRRLRASSVGLRVISVMLLLLLVRCVLSSSNARRRSNTSTHRGTQSSSGHLSIDLGCKSFKTGRRSVLMRLRCVCVRARVMRQRSSLYNSSRYGFVRVPGVDV